MNQSNREQQSSQVSQEELAKTQVLNLNDVKELASFERKTSKRPAVLFAIAGILSISLGVAYPNMMTALDNASLSDRKENNNVQEQKEPEILNKVQANEKVCEFYSPENPDGTWGKVVYTLGFNQENKLQDYTMVFIIEPLPGNAAGVTATQNIYNSYKAVDNIEINGYTMKTTLTDTGMKSVNNVNLEKLDKNTLTQTHSDNYFARVPFNNGDTKETVEQLLTQGGFKCK